VNAPADSLVIGAIGQPGERTFYAQVVVADRPSWFVIEKFHAAVFAVQARELLDDVGRSGAGGGLDPGTLAPPDAVTFRVGGIDLDYREDSGLIDIELLPVEAEGMQPFRFTVTPAQLDAAAEEASNAVEGGRPRCPRCGLAMDPDGHPCPAHNGDLRRHQA